MNDLLKLFIRDCRIDLRIGLDDNELQEPQPVIINVECETLPAQYFHDIDFKDLSQTVDYSRCYRFIQDELPHMGHIYLLESACEQIVSFCLSDPRVLSVRVRIEKTTVFAKATSAGIELYRQRT